MALKKFGAPLFSLELEDLSTPGTVFQMGLPPNRIDILTEIDGVTLDEGWANQESVDIYGLRLPLLGKRQLVINKKATGRPKDQIDVLWMESGNDPND